MKVAVISAREETAWQSCRSITRGLREVYSNVDRSWQVIEKTISITPCDLEAERLAEELVAARLDWIVFLDTWPSYGKLLQVLARGATKDRVRLRFHVYGDMTLRAYWWMHWQPSLQGFRVEWACASAPQTQLVASLLKSGEKAAWMCRFPVPVRDFIFDARVRAATRAKLGTTNGETLFLYTGRLSLQKNPIGLLRAYAKLPAAVLRKSRLLLVGAFDDLVAPFRGLSIVRGEYYRRWLLELQALPSWVASRVATLRPQSSRSLQELCCAADVFVSLSLQHDEDFGMSPAEAVSSGLPMILTRWGGYADLGNLGFAGDWIDVDLTPSGAAFSLDAVTRAMAVRAQERTLPKERLRMGELAYRELSVEAARDRIRVRTETSDPERFAGFQKRMARLSSIFDPGRGTIVYPGFGKGSLYEQIYCHYIGK